MPNHIINILRFKNLDKENIETLISGLTTVTNGERFFDFNKIIKTPDYIYQGNLGEKEREKYGKNNWYDWNREHWGTKWNAYDQRIIKGKSYVEFIFSTAWTMPYLIYEKLRDLGLDFEVKYADEDLGHHCGTFKYINGETIEEDKEGNYYWARNLWNK